MKTIKISLLVNYSKSKSFSERCNLFLKIKKNAYKRKKDKEYFRSMHGLSCKLT